MKTFVIVVPPQCGREVHITTVAAEPEAGPEREVLRLAGCARPFERVDVVRWGTGGRLYAAGQRDGAGPARVVAIDLATGAVHLVRDSVAGAVQAIARDGTWALVLRDSVEDRRFLKFAGDYRQLVRVDLATGAATVLVDSTRLPVPLYLPGDPRLPNDRLRWARLTGDDRQIVVGINVEQGDLWATRLVYHAVTAAGAPAGALAVTPGSPEDVVTLRP